MADQEEWLGELLVMDIKRDTLKFVHMGWLNEAWWVGRRCCPPVVTVPVGISAGPCAPGHSRPSTSLAYPVPLAVTHLQQRWAHCHHGYVAISSNLPLYKTIRRDFLVEAVGLSLVGWDISHSGMKAMNTARSSDHCCPKRPATNRKVPAPQGPDGLLFDQGYLHTVGTYPYAKGDRMALAGLMYEHASLRILC